MFKKIKTNHYANGGTSRETSFEEYSSNEVREDMARERRALRNRTEEGRVVSIETTMTTMVVLYASGTVVIFNWVVA